MASGSSKHELDVTERELASGEKVFGRYTLKKILGRGGMGIVWLAHDEELEREVALKFLPELIVQDRATLDELKRETKRSLELTHKNIVRIHDFVHDERSACISMEYVEGDTLANLRAEKESKVFEPNEIAVWTSQLCDALDYAHHHARIIHRDLKPSNLMVNQRGNLKVSDFGIARSLGDTVSRLTMENLRSGTLVYMSPQQLEGERGTHLDDIYSLGATLYDLLTSHPPFYSGNIDRQVRERPAPSMTERRKDLSIEPASVAAIWEETVAACLAKDPAQRPQSTAEVANRLQLSSAPGRAISMRRPKKRAIVIGGIAMLVAIALAGWYFGIAGPRQSATVGDSGNSQSPPPALVASIPEKSIAVLPFENLSSDKENAYFADGIQDEILTHLSKIADLKVISRTSTQHYKSAPENLPEIAKQLGVAHILQGSVQKSGEAVRVNVQLIKAANDSHLWADTFDRKLTDVFAIESEIAKSIADTLKARLTDSEEHAISARPTENIKAHQSYLKGRYFWNKRTGPHLQTAIDYLKQAIEQDSNYALAYAGLADSYVLLPLYAMGTPQQSNPPANAAAQKALELDPTLAEPHSTLGQILFYEFDFAESKREFERAIALDPNDATAHQWFGIGPLVVTGEFDRAIAEGKRAVELNPLSLVINTDLAVSYTMARRYPEAIEQFNKILAMDPRFYYARWTFGAALQFNGQLPEAIAQYKKAAELSDDPLVLAHLAQGYAKAGQRDEALKLLAQMEELATKRYVGARSFALVHLALGEKGKAIDELERGYRERSDPFIAFIKVNPLFDPLRGDPRFQTLLAKAFSPGKK